MANRYLTVDDKMIVDLAEVALMNIKPNPISAMFNKNLGYDVNIALKSGITVDIHTDELSARRAVNNYRDWITNGEGK